MRRTLVSLFMVMLLSLLGMACSKGGSSTPTSPTSRTAVVEINSLTATGKPWNTGQRYTINFNLIERGGVAIVIDDLTANVSAGTQPIGSYYWDVAGVFGSNRLLANMNRYANNLTIDVTPVKNPSGVHASTIKVSVVWNDDNGHRGTATATANVPAF